MGRIIKKKDQEPKVSLRNNFGVIQWQFENFEWQDLYETKELIGKQGIQGIQGIQGVKGESIEGEQGLTGLAGKDGLNGKDGKNGRNAIDGKDGKDASQLQLRKSKTHIQWKRVGQDGRINLVSLEELRGPEGISRQIFSGGGNAGGSDGGGSVAEWGSIIGTLADQTDLQAALDTKIEATSSDTLENKTIDADDNTVTNIGIAEIDTDVNDILDISNGQTLDPTTITVTATGGVISLNLEQSGGGDIRIKFSDGVYTFDSIPAATATLTAGSDTSPQINYVYILQSDKTLTVSTSSFPATEYAPIATVLCQSAASLETDGAYKVHAWSDHTFSGSGQGHISDINYWIRQQPATWTSGVSLTPAVGAGQFDIGTSSGQVLQLHQHTMPAFDTATGSDLYVMNDPDAAYNKVGDLLLASIGKDANGTVLGNPSTDFYNLVVWGAVNEASADCKLFINVPDGAYPNDNASQATPDTDATAVYTIPDSFVGVGFLIARLTVSVSAGTYTIEQQEDLRGTFPSTAAGGGGGVGGNEFVDNVFRIQDEGDTTREIAFEASAITTLTTRTITMPDADVNLGAIGNPYGANIVVASSGGDYTTLGGALTAAITGDIIYVKNGSYSESTFSDTALDQVVVIGQSRDGVIMDIVNNDFTYGGDQMQLSQMTFRSSGTGTWISSGADIEYVNMHFEKTSNTADYLLQLSGEGQKFSKCWFESDDTNTGSSERVCDFNSAYGIYSDCYFDANTSRSNGAFEFRANYAVVSGNVFRSKGTGTNYLIRLSNGMIFSNNEVREGSRIATAIQLAMFNGTISGNRFESWDRVLDQISGGFCMINSNVINDCDEGFDLDDAGNTVSGNYFNGRSTSAGIGLHLENDCDDNVVTGNRIRNFSVGCQVDSGATDNIVSANNLEGNTTGFTDNGTGTITDGSNVTS